jgi:acyl carrier protein
MNLAEPTPNERDVILTNVMNAARGLIQGEGWERAFADPITAETLLVGDLGCQSLDIIVLVADLSRRLGRHDFPLEKLLQVEGKPVTDISLGTLADFLWEHTRNRTPEEARNAA